MRSRMGHMRAVVASGEVGDVTYGGHAWRGGGGAPAEAGGGDEAGPAAVAAAAASGRAAAGARAATPAGAAGGAHADAEAADDGEHDGRDRVDDLDGADAARLLHEALAVRHRRHVCIPPAPRRPRRDRQSNRSSSKAVNTSGRTGHKSKLITFTFECTLTSWWELAVTIPAAGEIGFMDGTGGCAHKVEGDGRTGTTEESDDHGCTALGTGVVNEHVGVQRTHQLSLVVASPP